MEKLPLFIALGVIFATAAVIYVFIFPVLCRIFTHAPTFC